MRANEDMMPKLSICHGHGSKMNFSVSDYIRGDTAYLSLHHLWLESAKRPSRSKFHCAHLKCTFMMKYHTLNMLLGHSSSSTKLFRFRGFQKGKVHSCSSKDLWFTASQSLTHLAMRSKTGDFEEFVDKSVEPPTLTCCNFEVLWDTGVHFTFSETFKPN